MPRPVLLPLLLALAAPLAAPGCMAKVVIDYRQEVWTPVPTNATDELTAVQFLDATTGYVASAAGMILKTTDGGATFTRYAPVAVASRPLVGLSFLDAATGYAVSEQALFKTTDGGATWAEVYDFQAKHQDVVRAVKFVTATAGFVTCDKAVYQTLDGTSWIKADVKQVRALEAVGTTVYLAGEGLYTTDLTGVFVGLPAAGQLCGWSAGTCAADVHFLNAQEGWVYGGTTRMGALALQEFVFKRTRDGGRTWFDADPNGKLRKLSRETGPRTRTRVRFTSPDHGWVSQAGWLLATADGGASWHRQVQFLERGPFEPEQAMNDWKPEVRDLSSPDGTNAWIVGAEGKMWKWQQRYYPPYLDHDAPLIELWDAEKREVDIYR